MSLPPPSQFASMGATVAVALILGYTTRSTVKGGMPAGYSDLLRRYLVAWTLCIAGEWFGGPGVYALYASYGFTRTQVQQLYCLGFACSSVLGCFAGGFADRFGRKRSALLFCSFGCFTVFCKHFAYYPILFVGRFFDGAHASLLYTAFESWLVSEHLVRHKFPADLLGHSFSLMFGISYLVAVTCGEVAQIGKDLLEPGQIGVFHYGGWCFPFEMSALCQLIGGIYIAFTWDENYGDSEGDGDVEAAGARTPGPGLMKAFCNAKVLLCCILVTCIESSMFIFVINWTPALAAGGDKTDLPCGTIFAVFMLACMAGAALYRPCSGRRLKWTMLCVCVLATAAFAVPAFGGISVEARMRNLCAFVMFEVCIGVYFPAVGSLKSECVDERYRMTIYNLFRTPMNAIVVMTLLVTLPEVQIFQILFFLLAFASMLLIGSLIPGRARFLDEKAAPLLQTK